MTRARLLSLLLLPLALLFLPACASIDEPVGGCVLAAANKRQALRARGYLRADIPSAILAIHFAGSPVNHAVLIYHLDGGWFAYDDTSYSRALHIGNDARLPAPLVAGRAAFRLRLIDGAAWLDPER